MNKRFRLVSLILLLFVYMQGAGQSAPAAALPVSSPVNEYAVSLFANDVVMKNPNDDASGFLDIKQGTNLTAPPVLDLWYSCTTTLRSDLSSLTLLVNGKPVASRHLDLSANLRNNWQVVIPLEFIKAGVNEITLAVLHRSIDGLCRDIDNEGNWFTIRKETALRFQTGARNYALNNYPYPFINEYLANKINTILYMPQLDDASLIAMLGIASNLGNKAPAGVPWKMAVNIGVPSQQAAANEICIGLIDKWNSGAVNNYADNTAILQMSPLAGGWQRLLVSGRDEKGLLLAGEALNRDSFIKTASGNTITFNESKPPSIKLDKKKRDGYYSLADLGYAGDLTAAGAFHQYADIYFARPSNYTIGKGSFLEVYFRHSKVLDPKKSALTVYINGIPLNSAVLRPENADGGVLKVPIPDSELDKSGWQIRFGFYHDLGIVDCSKRYDDVAWSVIESRTNLYLAPGDKDSAISLSDFPYVMANKDAAVMNLTMWLSPEPTAEELTLATKVAYFIGQRNKTPIKWQIQQSADFDPASAKGTVIAIGKNTEMSARGNLQKSLAICPNKDGKINMADWLDVQPEIFNTQNSYQVAKISGSSDNLIYVFAYADAASMNNYLNLVLSGAKTLQGQVAFSDANGADLFFAKPQDKSVINNTWFNRLFSSTAGVYAGVVAVVILATAALMLYLRKRL